MGCDIHLYREKKVDNTWRSADEWEKPSWDDNDNDNNVDVPYEKRAYTGRNYELFGTLSDGVRRKVPFAFAPRGVPFDVSPEVANANKRWDGDGHSHSYLYLHELRDLVAFLDNLTIHIEGMKERVELVELRKTISTGNPDWTKLFPYCASTNNPNYEEFEIDVPALFYIGGCLRQIIASFEGVDGDNHRIVFWFDN